MIRSRSGRVKAETARLWRILRAMLSGVAVFALVFLLRRYGILEGISALIYALLLACLLPWSANLSRRILLWGALFLGWMPVLWWIKLPVPEVDRVGIALAAVSSGLVVWLLWAPGLRMRARRLIPEWAAVDAMPFAAAGLTAALTWPLVTARDGIRMLGLLIAKGYDHVGHFSMVLQTRAQGGSVTALGMAPDGSLWNYADYPQHLHATITALTDLHSGTALGAAAREVLLYGRSLALIQILTAMLLAAGVAQLAGFRRRPLLAWPAAGIVVGAFTVGPGVYALSAGYPNFVLACATAGLAALLAVPMHRELVPLRIFALGGLIVATVHGWALVGPVAVVAASVAFLPLGRERWPYSLSGRIVLAAVFVATMAASAAVIPMLASSGGMEVMVVGSEREPWALLDRISLALFVGGVATAAALALVVRRRTTQSVMKGIGLVTVPVVALMLAGAIAIYQLRKAGELSYYVEKMLIAVPLVSVVITVAVVALHLGEPSPVRGRLRMSMAVLVSIVGTIATFSAFGMVGVKYYCADTKRILASSRYGDEARRVLEAAAIAEGRVFGTTYYVAALPGDPELQLADQWQRSLSMMWTENRTTGAHALGEASKTSKGMKPEEIAELAQTLLAGGPDVAVTVAPQFADPVRDLLPADLGSRVLTWESQ